MLELTIFFGTFIATYFGVGLIRRWMLRRGHLAVPNERSSHTVPTPTGAGLVFAVAILLSLAISNLVLDIRIPYFYFAGASLILLISWLDDLYSVSFIIRFGVQIAAAIISVLGMGDALGGITVLGDLVIGPVWAGQLIGFVWIICLINSYNFMDGIDGIAGTQAIIAGAGYLLYGLAADNHIAVLAGGTIVFGSFAFLLHNWPPARIFMGDAGSAFLGYTLAVVPLMLQGGNTPQDRFPLIVGVAFVWPFIFDAGFTAVRRISNGQMLWVPSKEHLYQRLTVSGYSHRSVTVLYGLLALLTVASGIAAIWASTSTSLIVIGLTLMTVVAVLLAFCWKRGVLSGMNS